MQVWIGHCLAGKDWYPPWPLPPFSLLCLILVSLYPRVRFLTLKSPRIRFPDMSSFAKSSTIIALYLGRRDMYLLSLAFCLMEGRFLLRLPQF